MFGIAQPTSDGFTVRRKLPAVAQRHLKRLPDDVQAEHDDWARRTVHIDVHDIERRLIDAGLPSGRRDPGLRGRRPGLRRRA